MTRLSGTLIRPLHLLAASVLIASPAATEPPAAALETLLASDRAFAEASAKTDAVAGLSALFDAEVVMPLGAQGFARGKAEAVAALTASPANRGAAVTWAPIRGGISADGTHGFSFGYMTARRAGQPDQPGKYLAYWMRALAICSRVTEVRRAVRA